MSSIKIDVTQIIVKIRKLLNKLTTGIFYYKITVKNILIRLNTLSQKKNLHYR